MYNISPKTLFVGRKVIFLPTCHSTNTTALSLLDENQVFEGTIVITDNQTAGRGQRGSQWEAEAGKNLTFSLILKPGFLSAVEQFHLNMAVSLGLHAFLASFYSQETIKIKWPNDLYYKDKKIAGILIENTVKKHKLDYSVIGIGLNVNQLSFGDGKAISMRMALQQNTDFVLADLLSELAEQLERHYLLLRNGSVQTLKEQYVHRMFWFGNKHWFRQNGQMVEGEIVGIDSVGKLAIVIDNALCFFGLKEIEFMV